MTGDRGGRAPAQQWDLAPALAAAASRLAAAWPRRLAAIDPLADAVTPNEATACVEALAAALGDDLIPLIELGGLDRAEGAAEEMVGRLDAMLRRLEAIREEALNVAPDAETRQSLDASIATVGRQLAVQAAATLAGRAVAAEERARTESESLAMTMHELRRPLTVLSSYAQLFEAGSLGELTDRGAHAVRSMLAASEVMLRLIEALAALSRLEDPAQPAELGDLPVSEVVEAAVEQASVEADLRGVVVERRVDPGLRLLADRARLTLAVTNLVSNAVKHSPPGGVVSVEAHGDGGAVHLLVRDRGPGFASDTAERLFEKYYRDPAERARRIPGTGLGLYLVRAVAERHGGTATARPADGGGAEFELVLPQR